MSGSPQPRGSRTRDSERLTEIDALKGIAILWDFAIHAALFSGTFFATHVINRAVPIFLVLFGYTSTIWWKTSPP